MKRNLVLRMKQGLGDTIAFSGLIRDISRTYPNQFAIHADTWFRSLWNHNPNVAGVHRLARMNPGDIQIEIDYRPAVGACQTSAPMNMQQGLCVDFTNKTGMPLSTLTAGGTIPLMTNEQRSPVRGRYWVIAVGGKLDMTVKHWRADRYQEVVNVLRRYGIQCVQIGSTSAGHVHPDLQGVLNAIGRTEDPRELCSLIANADGVICGITGAMHIAAAYQKPCVVIAGGRENPGLFAHSEEMRKAGTFGNACSPIPVSHKILHTVGLLPCCENNGCWKKRTVPLDVNDRFKNKHRLCLQPERLEGQTPTPACMNLITVDHVVEAVMHYYEEKMIPPIGIPSGKYTSTEQDPIALAPIAFVNAEPAKNAEMAVKVMPEEYPVTAQQEKVIKTGGVYDHPTIGGRFTIFVLCYGDYPDLAKRCINGILETVPLNRVDLRVAANACSERTLRFLADMPLNHLRISAENRLKYPVMREMFNDPSNPITSEYILWFDDDSYVVHPKWLSITAETIIQGHAQGCRMFGWRHYHNLTKCYGDKASKALKWFQDADWWRGRMLRVVNGRALGEEAPNGNGIEFIPGSFWALNTQVMREMGIPDKRLIHRGDISMGAQVHQAGYKIGMLNGNNSLVYMDGAKRRGLDARLPWDPQELENG